MNLFVSEIVTPPARLPITVPDTTLARGVVEEIERTMLWRAIVRQERKIVIDGALPVLIEIERSYRGVHREYHKVDADRPRRSRRRGQLQPCVTRSGRGEHIHGSGQELARAHASYRKFRAHLLLRMGSYRH